MNKEVVKKDNVRNLIDEAMNGVFAYLQAENLIDTGDVTPDFVFANDDQYQTALDAMTDYTIKLIEHQLLINDRI